MRARVSLENARSASRKVGSGSGKGAVTRQSLHLSSTSHVTSMLSTAAPLGGGAAAAAPGRTPGRRGISDRCGRARGTRHGPPDGLPAARTSQPASSTPLR